jgi:hypothetical protein
VVGSVVMAFPLFAHDVIKSLICPTEQVKIGKCDSSLSGHATLHGVVLRILIRTAATANGRAMPAVIGGKPGSGGYVWQDRMVGAQGIEPWTSPV